MLSALEQIEHALAVFIVGFGLAYFFAGLIMGIRRWRRAGLPSQEPTAAKHDYTLYFLIAALNEAEVIGETVQRLAAVPGAVVFLVDDASSDGTGDIAQAAGGEACVVVRRALPDARKGKGPALNAGYARLLDHARDRGVDPQHTLVCVMDADGHLSDRAVEHVLPLFDDETVGGAQLAVRIRNRQKMITRIQDIEFWALSALSQFARVSFGNVSLGGNGQFTRLSDLMRLDAAPWSGSLTEDLDLAVRMTLLGRKLVSTPLAWVDQQAIVSWRRLIRQRTRWMQGHMTSGKYIPDLLASEKAPNGAAIETVLYLSVPWVLVLPWSILYHLLWAQSIYGFVTHGIPMQGGPGSTLIYFVFLYVVSFLPMIVAGLVYHSRDPKVGWIRAILVGHLLIPGFYIGMIAAWRAVFRMVRGRVGWDKTERETETAVATEQLVRV
jgi:cellulose synthase/poly-beta-1,6-N-acetylglucosamine synthase-like glycosyltransferase